MSKGGVVVTRHLQGAMYRCEWDIQEKRPTPFFFNEFRGFAREGVGQISVLFDKIFVTRNVAITVDQHCRVVTTWFC